MATTSTTPPLSAPIAVPIDRSARAVRTVSPGGPMVQAFRRTVRNPLGLFGLVVLSVLVLCAIGAPVISPYNPLEQHVGDDTPVMTDAKVSVRKRLDALLGPSASNGAKKTVATTKK